MIRKVAFKVICWEELEGMPIQGSYLGLVNNGLFDNSISMQTGFQQMLGANAKPGNGRNDCSVTLSAFDQSNSFGNDSDE